MNNEDRIRRVVILCCHCLRNIAFYRAGWKQGDLRIKRQYWVNANGNFLDIAVLEWCKIFAERSGKHHWRKVISNNFEFATMLYAHLGMSKREFENYAKPILKYRNKFVAHLDEERVAHIPRIRPALKSVAYLYDHLLNDPIAKKCLPDAQPSATEFYAMMYKHAYQEYRRSTQPI
jgi:hypothetical protein